MLELHDEITGSPDTISPIYTNDLPHQIPK